MGDSPREFLSHRPEIKTALWFPVLLYMPFLHWIRRLGPRKVALLLVAFVVLLAGMELLMQKTLYGIPEVELAEKVVRLDREVAARCGVVREVLSDNRTAGVSMYPDRREGYYGFDVRGDQGQAHVVVRWKSLGQGRDFEVTDIRIESALRSPGPTGTVLLFCIFIPFSAVVGYVAWKTGLRGTARLAEQEVFRNWDVASRVGLVKKVSLDRHGSAATMSSRAWKGSHRFLVQGEQGTAEVVVHCQSLWRDRGFRVTDVRIDPLK